MSLKAESKYLLSNNLLNFVELRNNSIILPTRHKNWKSFHESFGSNNYEHNFLGYKIVIDVRYAFKHFQENTYGENRQNINATLLPTLLEPLIVTKNIHEGKNTLNFYKSFLSPTSEIIHITMYHAIETTPNTYKFKTIYIASTIEKVRSMIKEADFKTLFVKD